MQILVVNKLTNRALNDSNGGGDYFLCKDFIDYISVDSPRFTRTTINDSIECHLMGFKAEESRQKGGIPLEINL